MATVNAYREITSNRLDERDKKKRSQSVTETRLRRSSSVVYSVYASCSPRRHLPAPTSRRVRARGNYLSVLARLRAIALVVRNAYCRERDLSRRGRAI